MARAADRAKLTFVVATQQHAVFGIHRFGRKGEIRHRLAGDDVWRGAAGDAHFAAVEFLCIGRLTDVFFGVDDRILPVRREGQRGVRLGLFVTGDAAPAALFVTAQKDAYAALERDARLFDRAEGVERGDRGAFVIHHTATDQSTVSLREGKGIARPAVAGGHDVQMRHDHEHLVAFAVVDHAAVAVERTGGKAHFPREIEGIGQRVVDISAKRHAFFRFALGNARKRNEFAERGKLLVKVLVD